MASRFTCTRVHRLAMEDADKAAEYKKLGKDRRAAQLLHRAFILERHAALEAIELNLEPTRSVLCRSAASLALEVGLLPEAFEMATLGLAGSPPSEIAAELRDIVNK